jgi:uncharacterized protein (DUF433 family)
MCGSRSAANWVKHACAIACCATVGGVPCLRGLRIPVATVVAAIADGMTEAEILAAYSDLEREDVGEALRYAADAVCERELPLVGG